METFIEYGFTNKYFFVTYWYDCGTSSAKEISAVMDAETLLNQICDDFDSLVSVERIDAVFLKNER